MIRDEAWLKNYNELKAWVEVHHHYPPEHTNLHSWTRRNIKQRNKGELPEWKVKMLCEVESMVTIQAVTSIRLCTTMWMVM